MSSLYKRSLKSGDVYYAQVKLRDGTWKKFNTHATTKQTAQEVLAATEAEIVSGRDPFRRTTVGTLISEVVPAYLEKQTERLRPATLRSYNDTLSKFKRAVGDISIEDIDRRSIDMFKSTLSDLSRHSQNIHLANLRAFLMWYKREITPDWAPPRIDRARTDPLPTVDYYNGAECRRILEAAKSVWFKTKHGKPTFSFYPFVAVLMFTGLRKQEAANLRWEAPDNGPIAWPWVDMQQGQIVIPASSSKSRRARYVPIINELRPLLDEWPAEKAGRLFPFDVSGGRVVAKWSEVCRLAGVKRLKMHNLRDTFAVGLLLSGVPWAVVGEILGHASVETTKRYYAAIGKSELTAAVGKVSLLR